MQALVLFSTVTFNSFVLISACQGADYDRVYEVYVLTFWRRSAEKRVVGSPRMNWYINKVDEDSFCKWYEPYPPGKINPWR